MHQDEDFNFILVPPDHQDETLDVSSWYPGISCFILVPRYFILVLQKHQDEIRGGLFFSMRYSMIHSMLYSIIYPHPPKPPLPPPHPRA